MSLRQIEKLFVAVLWSISLSVILYWAYNHQAGRLARHSDSIASAKDDAARSHLAP